MDQLIAARLVQAAGGGVLVPVATAAAAHLFDGGSRPRALGVVGALTFLGMAAGPFVGATILGSVDADAVARSALAPFLTPAWRWVFYLNIPIGLIALLLGWAASAGWDTPRRAGRLDLRGATWFGLALLLGLVGLTLVGTDSIGGFAVEPIWVTAALLAAALMTTAVWVRRGLRVADPFLDPRLFADRTFSAASLVSLLTGYAFATAIIGAAVFVDRVIYGGPDQQRLALGALAGATAVGALGSGFAVRVLSLRAVTLIGLALAIGGLVAMSRWSPETPVESVALTLAVFGLGFGLTVTPRSGWRSGWRS
jgi:MFS family permease